MNLKFIDTCTVIKNHFNKFNFGKTKKVYREKYKKPFSGSGTTKNTLYTTPVLKRTHLKRYSSYIG